MHQIKNNDGRVNAKDWSGPYTPLFALRQAEPAEGLCHRIARIRQARHQVHQDYHSRREEGHVGTHQGNDAQLRAIVQDYPSSGYPLMLFSCKALGLFSKKQYAPNADMRFIMKLPTERCLECTIWAVFLSRSL